MLGFWIQGVAMKSLFLILCVFFSLSAKAQSIEINLTEDDQAKLTNEISKIDSANRVREIVQESPYIVVKATYFFLSVKDGFSIKCSEKFLNASTIGTEQSCIVKFNYEASIPGELEVSNGFMPEFAIAKVLSPSLARTLYKTIGNGVSPAVFFNTKEQIIFTHPKTGQKFPAFRMRIDCKRDEQHKNFSCSVSAVK